MGKKVKISQGHYKYQGYDIQCHGYFPPDRCIWWEATDEESGYADYHGTTLASIIKDIDEDIIKEKNKTYFHEMTDEEYSKALNEDKTPQDFKQPAWCKLYDALNPYQGCSILTQRQVKSKIDCEECEDFLENIKKRRNSLKD